MANQLFYNDFEVREKEMSVSYIDDKRSIILYSLKSERVRNIKEQIDKFCKFTVVFDTL